MNSQQPTIIKLSYSILSQWSMKRFEEAVNSYMGKGLPLTPYIELGRVKHELWDAQIQQNKRIPDELGGGQLIAPKPENFYERLIPLGGNYAILLRGIVDCLDGTTIYEWKCGLKNATGHIGSMQLDYYKLLIPEAELGIYRCYNPYSEDYTTGVKFLTDYNFNKALEHVVTFGSEMIDYLQSQRLLVNYKPEIYGKQLELLNE